MFKCLKCWFGSSGGLRLTMWMLCLILRLLVKFVDFVGSWFCLAKQCKQHSDWKQSWPTSLFAVFLEFGAWVGQVVIEQLVLKCCNTIISPCVVSFSLVFLWSWLNVDNNAGPFVHPCCNVIFFWVSMSTTIIAFAIEARLPVWWQHSKLDHVCMVLDVDLVNCVEKMFALCIHFFPLGLWIWLWSCTSMWSMLFSSRICLIPRSLLQLWRAWGHVFNW